jgi:hypothetical protein
VSNTGNVTFARSAVAIVDDNGTTANGADDLSVANGKITYQSGDDSNANNQSWTPNEVWLYQGHRHRPGPERLMGAATTFDFNGQQQLRTGATATSAPSPPTRLSVQDQRLQPRSRAPEPGRKPTSAATAADSA